MTTNALGIPAMALINTVIQSIGNPILDNLVSVKAEKMHLLQPSFTWCGAGELSMYCNQVAIS